MTTMASRQPDTVEQWAPLFLFFAGTSEAKFTKEQVLDPKFALAGSYCKLCDCHFEGSGVKHMREHRKQLTAWLDKRKRENRKRSKAGLATWRKEQELLAKTEADGIVANPNAYIGEEDED
jgi:hypothetical protein